MWLVPVRPRPDWLGLLDPAERLRAERLAGWRAGDVHVTSRAAQRLIGSRYLGVAPDGVQIDRVCEHCGAAHGKPRLRGSAIDYSVSHTEHWLIMAVIGSGQVGADIESQESITHPEILVRTALSEAEIRIFHRLSTARRAAWLLRTWTRKEAAMKLTGLGLRVPPNQVDVSTPLVRVGEVARWPDSPIHLRRLYVPDSHAATLAGTVPMVTVRRFKLPGDVGDTDPAAAS